MEMLSRDSIDYVIEGHSLADVSNYHEQMVLEALREVYASANAPCRCSLCVEDIYALALNSLPPRYIQATSVRSYESSRDFVSQEAVRDKVRQAAERVRKNPNH